MYYNVRQAGLPVNVVLRPARVRNRLPRRRGTAWDGRQRPGARGWGLGTEDQELGTKNRGSRAEDIGAGDGSRKLPASCVPLPAVSRGPSRLRNDERCTVWSRGLDQAPGPPQERVMAATREPCLSLRGLTKVFLTSAAIDVHRLQHYPRRRSQTTQGRAQRLGSC